MRCCRRMWIRGIVLSALLFLWDENAAAVNRETETAYYYVVQSGDSLWKISRELYGEGGKWEWLYRDNCQIFDPAKIYPGEELKISGYAFPENADERFLAKEQRKTNYQWLFTESYVHMDEEKGERSEYPEKTERDALRALKEGDVEDWLAELTSPILLTEEEKDKYRERDPENILYSYEAERGLVQDKWYLLTESNGSKLLVIENWKRGKEQEFYCFYINSGTEEIGLCEKFHGAGGRLYLAEENGIMIWIMTKETEGEITGIAGDYRGEVYIGGNFYYERKKNGIVKEFYQIYHSIGNGTMAAEGATFVYPY